MKSTLGAFVAVSLAVGSSVALGDKFFDQPSFEAGVDIAHVNTFDSLTLGSVDMLEFSSGDISYTITASGPGGGGLFVHDGFLSTESGLDGILITLTSDNVTAVGGNGWAVDSLGRTVGGYLEIELDDGTRQSYSSTGPDNFQGFTSTAPIRTMFLEMPHGTEPLFVGFDNIMLGTPVPAPATLALLGLGGLAASRRRR